MEEGLDTWIPDPEFRPVREKTWDRGMTSDVRRLVYARRFNPDGEQKQFRVFSGKPRYPWKELEDGDYFIAPFDGKSRNATLVGFRQAAARHDIEIAIRPMLWGVMEAYRVTRVIGGVSVIKKLARARGANAPAHDPKLAKARWQRCADRRAGETGAPVDATQVADTPADPLGRPPGGQMDPYDRRAMLAAAIRRAQGDLK